MLRKKILWLVSWYPNKNDAFDGDFIQRHARAAAIYHDVHVIFVTEREIEKREEEEFYFATGLTEQIIYIQKPSGFLAKLKKQWRWRTVYQKAIEHYVSTNGLPHYVHVHVPWKAGLIALWMKNKFGTSFMVSEHWGIYGDGVDDSFNKRPAFVKALIKNVFAKADKVIAVSNFLGEGLQKMTGRKPGVLLPNVVDTTLFHPQTEKYSRFTFIHVSNMVPLKNVDLILRAFKELVQSIGGDMQMVLIGNRNDEYVRMADEMGLLNRNIFFKGEVSYTEVAEEARRSHCFVLFSNSETFSCVTAEALCCGMPVIASKVGALPELVDDTNGVLVQPNSVTELASAMQKAMDNYFEFDSVVMAKRASAKYGYAAIAERFKELYGS